MKYQNKTKDELIKELRELQQEYNSLKAEYDKDNISHKKVEKELIVANNELVFQSDLREKRAQELIIANKELVAQSELKEKRAAELIIANKELAFQNHEKEKRAAELIIANKELAFQNDEKEKRAAELIIANKELVFQSEMKEKRALELVIANKELAFQNDEKEKRAAELITAKEHAEESDRLKSAFLANMSHEIRTPMNGILGFASLLKEADLFGEEQQQYIKIIEKSGARMLNIINDIVDISKIESGLMEVNLKMSNINEQIDFVYTFFKPETERKRIQFLFQKSLPSKEATIKTDREKIYAILTNLVKNAIKYCGKGTIELGYNLVETPIGTLVETQNIASLPPQPQQLQFYVKDTGIGIPKDRQKAIFERFIQADISDKMALQGAGLGLSISKAYVEMLGGKIWVNSENGKGSAFYFTIPYNTDPEKKIVTENHLPSFKADNKIENLKILIVEDDDTSYLLIFKILKAISHEVLHAKTGVEAIEMCSKNPDLDLVLMDIRMPEMNGYDATRRIRKFNKEVIIIAQTSFALTPDKSKAIESGCNDYLSKPILKDELLALIHKYFNKKGAN